jgi:hypothetical protein
MRLLLALLLLVFLLMWVPCCCWRLNVSNDAGVPAVANFPAVGGTIFQHLLFIFVKSPNLYQRTQRPNWPPRWGPLPAPPLAFGLAARSSTLYALRAS